MAALTKARKPPRSEPNTFRLPQGEPIRRALVAEFRRERTAVLRALGLGRKDQGEPYPDDFSAIFGVLDLADRMTPLLAALWDSAGAKLYSRVGLDPDAWSVVNPYTAGKIEQAALDFCAATMQTTSLSVNDAISKTREELAAGIVDRGESVAKLTDRIAAVFDHAERYRARRIAASEASRAVHAAQEQAAFESGVVVGFRWLLSTDACSACQEVAAKVRAVRLGQRFATVGDHPVYSEVRHPPLHPGCQCAMTEVLGTDAPPEWGSPVTDPGQGDDTNEVIP